MARGTSYPYIGLEDAVGLTRKVYDFSKRSPANLGAVVKDQWKYSPTSSSAQKVVAALRYFGLVEVQGGGKGPQASPETIKITERAFRILVDSPDSPERKKAIVDAFMEAKAYKLCWTTWGADMPPSMRSTLIFSHGFHESSVDGFLKDYKKSVQFAGLLDANEENTRETERAVASEVALGDFVQWEHDGVLGLPKPLKLVKLSEDGMFGWLEGHTAGSALPIAELVKTDPPPTVTPTHAVAPIPPSPAPAPLGAARAYPESKAIPPKGIGMRQEIFSLVEGDVTIQWPERIGKESLQDFLDWWPILKRKVERSLVVDDPKGVANPDGSPPQ